MKFIPYICYEYLLSAKNSVLRVTLSRKTFTRSCFFPQIGSTEQEEECGFLFQQSDAPSHFSYEVQNALNVRFCNWWTGRGRPTPWPPWSPDLSPLDIFVGVYEVTFMQRKVKVKKLKLNLEQAMKVQRRLAG